MRPEGNGGRGHGGATRLLLFSVVLAGCSGSAPQTPAPPAEGLATEPTPASYTAEQATRGQRVFGNVCAVCHGRNEFIGPIFALTWRVEPVGALFEHISTKMPQDRPGSLTADEYAAIVAYLLQLNGRPAGERELPADAELLSRMRW